MIIPPLFKVYTVGIHMVDWIYIFVCNIKGLTLSVSVFPKLCQRFSNFRQYKSNLIPLLKMKIPWIHP